MPSIESILVDGQDPSMPALRAYLANLSASVAAAANGFRTFADLATLNAYTPAAGEPTYAFVINPEFAAYKFNGALPWVVDDSYFQGVAAVVQPLVDEARGFADDASATAALVQASLTALNAATKPLTIVSAARSSDGWFNLAEEWKTFSGIITGDDLPTGKAFSALVFGIAMEAGTVALHLELWKTPLAAPDAYDPTSSDILITDEFYQLIDLGISAGYFQRVPIPLRASLTKEAAFNIKWRVSAVKTGNVLANIAILRAEGGGGSLTQGQRGWGFRGVAVVAIAAPQALSWEVESYVPIDAYPDQASSDVALLSSADQVFHADATVIQRTVTIANGVLARFGQRIGFSGTVPIERPPIDSFANVPYTLEYTNGRPYRPFLSAKLPSGNLTGVVVKDASTNAVLVEGVDYIGDYRFGGFGRATAGAARNVLISGASSRERYDLICVDPEYLSLYVVPGATNYRDASERMPDIGTTNGAAAIPMRLPLFYARSTFSAIELVKVYNLRDGIAREFEPQIASDLSRNRKALASFLRKLDAGLPVIISAMGDSITALQSQEPDRLVPNGPYRDRATASGTQFTYLREGIIAPDLIDALPLYDNGDGAGAVHTRFGRVWEMIRAIEKRYGSAVTYRNYSIAGTSSDDSFLGMTNPDRLAAWAEDGADLAIAAPGMNDADLVNSAGGDTILFNRVRKMIDAKLAEGGDVVVLGCSRPQQGAVSDATWLKINRVLRQAAQTPGWGGKTAAFVDYTLISYGPGAATMGVSKADYTISNGYNHPGIRQHAIEGELGRKVIFA